MLHILGLQLSLPLLPLFICGPRFSRFSDVRHTFASSAFAKEMRDFCVNWGMLQLAECRLLLF